jgi:hypothetical protein
MLNEILRAAAVDPSNGLRVGLNKLRDREGRVSL